MRTFLSAASVAAAMALPALSAQAEVVVFQFSGVISQIADFSGQPRLVAPIPIGSTFTGTFQYEVNQSPSFSNPNFSRYTGACNSWRITVAGLDFYSAPTEAAALGVGLYPGTVESFSIGTGDVVVPPGWSIPHTSQSDGYVLILQNVPDAGVLGNSTAPPATLNLAQWTSYHEIRMDFYEGVTFPGGQYSDRTTVVGNVQSITQLPSVTVTTNPTVQAFPTSGTFGAGQTATIPMNVTGIGTLAPTFQWRRNNSNLTPGGRIHVSPTGALSIDAVTVADMGVYDCIVNYGCGTTILGPVALGVQACPADVDRNGAVNVADIFAFLSSWFAGCP